MPMTLKGGGNCYTLVRVRYILSLANYLIVSPSHYKRSIRLCNAIITATELISLNFECRGILKDTV
jgi:hypothetical protein